MSWSTAAALAAIVALTALAASAWTAHCKRKYKERLRNEYEQAAKALQQALEDEPDNLALHANLRANLLRVCALVDKFDAFGL